MADRADPNWIWCDIAASIFLGAQSRKHLPPKLHTTEFAFDALPCHCPCFLGGKPPELHANLPIHIQSFVSISCDDTEQVDKRLKVTKRWTLTPISLSIETIPVDWLKMGHQNVIIIRLHKIRPIWLDSPSFTLSQTSFSDCCACDNVDPPIENASTRMVYSTLFIWILWRYAWFWCWNNGQLQWIIWHIFDVYCDLVFNSNLPPSHWRSLRPMTAPNRMASYSLGRRGEISIPCNKLADVPAESVPIPHRYRRPLRPPMNELMSNSAVVLELMTIKSSKSEVRI